MKQYFYIDSNKQQIGPLAEDALMVLVRCGAIYGQTLIWTEGLTDWMPFSIVFPECAEEVSPTPIAVESSTAALDFPVDEELMEQLRPLRKYRKIFIIGGIVAIIAAIFHPAYFISSEIDTQGDVGQKALAHACWEENVTIAELLLAAGIDVNKWDALAYAADRGRAEMVKLLLTAPNIDVNGESPLAAAAGCGHTEIVRLFLDEPGIDAEKTGEFGLTPLALAAENGHTEIVKLLRAAGAREKHHHHTI